MRPSIVYVLPGSGIHGGIRVVLEHAEGMQARGYSVQIIGPEPRPDWHPFSVPYLQVDLARSGSVPAADVCVGTLWTTVRAAFESGSAHVFHFCQGFEGIHPEHAPILDQIDEVYRLPIPKLLVSPHLESMLVRRYGCRCYLVGQEVDSDLFSPGEFRVDSRPLRIGVVGPYGVRPKGIHELLEGLRRAREKGFFFEVHHASGAPYQVGEAQLGVTDFYYSRLDTRQMVDFYRGLDGYIHPSHDEEGLPLPPLEAMACGVPVALTAISSFAVIPDQAVLRFSPGDPDAIAPIVDLLSDAKRRHAMREAGLRWVREQTLERVLDRFEAALASEGAPLARSEVVPESHSG